MKNLVIAPIIFLLFAMLFGCAEKKESNKAAFSKQPAETQKATPNPDSTNPISGPISKANYKSAMSDATNALTMLMTELAEEGIAQLDDNVVFEVTKDDGVYNFVYKSGELEFTEEEVHHSEEITPETDSWLQNVRVFKA